jgi:hypothetical protein
MDLDRPSCADRIRDPPDGRRAGVGSADPRQSATTGQSKLIRSCTNVSASSAHLRWSRKCSDSHRTGGLGGSVAADRLERPRPCVVHGSAGESKRRASREVRKPGELHEHDPKLLDVNNARFATLPEMFVEPFKAAFGPTSVGADNKVPATAYARRPAQTGVRTPEEVSRRVSELRRRAARVRMHVRRCLLRARYLAPYDSNAGHEFGTNLPPNDRASLLEYLKSLEEPARPPLPHSSACRF